MIVFFFPVGVGVNQTTMGMGHVTVVGVGQRIPLHTADLIHISIGDHNLNLDIGIKNLFQAFRRHQSVGNLAGRTLMMAVNGFPALAVGHGQSAAFL